MALLFPVASGSPYWSPYSSATRYDLLPFARFTRCPQCALLSLPKGIAPQEIVSFDVIAIWIDPDGGNGGLAFSGYVGNQLSMICARWHYVFCHPTRGGTRHVAERFINV